MSLGDIQLNIKSGLKGSGLDDASRKVSSLASGMGRASKDASAFASHFENEFGRMGSAAGAAGTVVAKFLTGGIWGAGAAIVNVALGSMIRRMEQMKKELRELREAGFKALEGMRAGFHQTMLKGLNAALEEATTKADRLTSAFERTAKSLQRVAELRSQQAGVEASMETINIESKKAGAVAGTKDRQEAAVVAARYDIQIAEAQGKDAVRAAETALVAARKSKEDQQKTLKDAQMDEAFLREQLLTAKTERQAAEEKAAKAQAMADEKGKYEITGTKQVGGLFSPMGGAVARKKYVEHSEEEMAERKTIAEREKKALEDLQRHEKAVQQALEAKREAIEAGMEKQNEGTELVRLADMRLAETKLRAASSVERARLDAERLEKELQLARKAQADAKSKAALVERRKDAEQVAQDLNKAQRDVAQRLATMQGNVNQRLQQRAVDVADEQQNAKDLVKGWDRQEKLQGKLDRGVRLSKRDQEWMERFVADRREAHKLGQEQKELENLQRKNNELLADIKTMLQKNVEVP